MNMIDPNLSKRNIETTTSYDFASQEYKISFSWLNSVYPKNYSIKQICSLIEASTVFSKDFSYLINTIIPDNRTNPPEWPSQEEHGCGLTSSASVSDVCAPAYTNRVRPLLQLVSVA